MHHASSAVGRPIMIAGIRRSISPNMSRASANRPSWPGRTANISDEPHAQRRAEMSVTPPPSAAGSPAGPRLVQFVRD